MSNSILHVSDMLLLKHLENFSSSNLSFDIYYSFDVNQQKNNSFKTQVNFLVVCNSLTTAYYNSNIQCAIQIFNNQTLERTIKEENEPNQWHKELIQQYSFELDTLYLSAIPCSIVISNEKNEILTYNASISQSSLIADIALSKREIDLTPDENDEIICKIIKPNNNERYFCTLQLSSSSYSTPISDVTDTVRIYSGKLKTDKKDPNDTDTYYSLEQDLKYISPNQLEIAHELICKTYYTLDPGTHNVIVFIGETKRTFKAKADYTKNLPKLTNINFYRGDVGSTELPADASELPAVIFNNMVTQDVRKNFVRNYYNGIISVNEAENYDYFPGGVAELSQFRFQPTAYPASFAPKDEKLSVYIYKDGEKNILKETSTAGTFEPKSIGTISLPNSFSSQESNIYYADLIIADTRGFSIKYPLNFLIYPYIRPSIEITNIKDNNITMDCKYPIYKDFIYNVYYTIKVGTEETSKPVELYGPNKPPTENPPDRLTIVKKKGLFKTVEGWDSTKAEIIQVKIYIADNDGVEYYEVNAQSSSVQEDVSTPLFYWDDKSFTIPAQKYIFKQGTDLQYCPIVFSAQQPTASNYPAGTIWLQPRD